MVGSSRDRFDLKMGTFSRLDILSHFFFSTWELFFFIVWGQIGTPGKR